MIITSEYSVKATLTLIGAWIGSKIFSGIYNVWFHPLARFPGPKVAALTNWYKTYHDVWLWSSWTSVLRLLHEKYGKVVRIGPNELHFSDPSVYSEIYTTKNRWDKERDQYQAVGVDHSSFGFLTFAEAKKRKDIINPLFSRRAILELENLVQSNVDKLCEILKRNNTINKSSNLYFGLRCFTLDTITSFCFAKSFDCLNEPGFKASLVESMDASLPAFNACKNFKLLRIIVFNIPVWLGIRLTPTIKGLSHLRHVLMEQVKEILENPASLDDAPHRIIYHELTNLEATKGERISAFHLREEAQNLVIAGTDTTANAIMLGMYHVLDAPDMVQRLKSELQEVWPVLENSPGYEELEKLPFLTAVVKESLRIVPGGVTYPLLRVVPCSGATINGAMIPSGTIVSIGQTFVQNSEELFKDPKAFNPNRWLQYESGLLDKWLVPFSKGPRMCIGQNLAYCELYLAIAALIRRFDFELDMEGARAADLTWRDYFIPLFEGRHLHAFCRPAWE